MTNRRTFSHRSLTAILLMAVLSGCAVTADSTQPQERQQRAQSDRQALFGQALPLEHPLTLYQAQALALQRNVDYRLRLMEEAATLRLNDVAGYAMLPQLAASGGYSWRSEKQESTSFTPATNSWATPAISSDQSHFTSSLATAWNVLDFGVSYLRARQQANLVLVAQERRRKAVQVILNEVRSAYWRSLNAQLVEDQLAPLATRAQNAMNVFQNDKSIRWSSPAQKLEYQRTMLEILQQLQYMYRDVEAARMDLAALLNVEFDRNLVLARPIGFDARSVLQPVNPGALEMLALENRPELREEDYQSRITADETRKAILRMMPGIELGTSLSTDSNSYIFPHSWAEASLKMTWNLMNLVAGPATLKAANTQENVGYLRRLSVSMAILAQVNVATRRFALSRADYDLAEGIANVDQEQLNQCGCGTKGTPMDEVEYLRRATMRLMSRYRGDAAFVEVQNAAGAIAVSVGNDPVPDDLKLDDSEQLAQQLERQAAAWSVVRQPLFKAPPATTTPIQETPLPANPVAGKLTRLEQDPALRRFIMLARLQAKGLITADEFAARRYPNLGALLPYAEPPPAADLFTAPPALETLTQQLPAAKNTAARNRVLDQILPRKGAARTLPAAHHPAALAAARTLIADLLQVGLVTAAEADRERAAIAHWEKQ